MTVRASLAALGLGLRDDFFDARARRPGTPARATTATPTAPAAPIAFPRLLGTTPAPAAVELPDLDQADLYVASRLRSALSDPELTLIALMQLETDPAEEGFDDGSGGEEDEAVGAGQVALRQSGSGGVGPAGEPLIPLRTELGMTAFVDPNAQAYYLAEDTSGQTISAHGPLPLPEEVEFPDRDYGQADVAALTRIVNGTEVLSLRDRQVAASLSGGLANPRLNAQVLADVGIAVYRLERTATLSLRCPAGRPLVPVQTRDGQRVFVDPNTNTYYLKLGRELNGADVKGPLPLPNGLRFSAAFFTDKECDHLAWLAQPRWMPPFMAA